MSQKNETGVQKTITARPLVTSYDSGHEHSVEHWIEVRLMVEKFEEEETISLRAFAAGA